MIATGCADNVNFDAEGIFCTECGLKLSAFTWADLGVAYEHMRKHETDSRWAARSRPNAIIPEGGSEIRPKSYLQTANGLTEMTERDRKMYAAGVAEGKETGLLAAHKIVSDVPLWQTKEHERGQVMRGSVNFQAAALSALSEARFSGEPPTCGAR